MTYGYGKKDAHNMCMSLIRNYFDSNTAALNFVRPWHCMAIKVAKQSAPYIGVVHAYNYNYNSMPFLLSKSVEISVAFSFIDGNFNQKNRMKPFILLILWYAMHI